MKRSINKIGRLLAALLVVTAMGIAGCASGGSEKDTSSMDAGETSWPAMDTLASISASDISSIQYTRATVGGIESDTITDATRIEDVYLRLKDVSIKGTSEAAVDDDGLTIKLETPDKTLGFNFEGDILVLEDGSRYDAENLSSLKNYIDGLIAESTEPAKTTPDSSTDGDTADTSEGSTSTDTPVESSVSPNSGGSTESTAASKNYDVSENFTKTSNSDGSIEYLYFNDFVMIMPGNEKWSFEMNGDSVTFYLFSAQQEGYGGKLVTIKAYDMDDNSYEQLPSYHVAGVGSNVGKRFIAIYPTDVQWNGADSTQDADYRDLKDYLWKIGEGAVNSPLQTADSNPAP